MSFHNKKNSFLGFLAGLFSKSPAKLTIDDLKKADFKTAAGDMGVRFTERIRDVFRFKWIR